MKRKKAPSRAVKIGAPAGAALGAVLDVAAAVSGHPLPPGAGAALGGTLATLFAYFTRGGRSGESD